MKWIVAGGAAACLALAAGGGWFVYATWFHVDAGSLGIGEVRKWPDLDAHRIGLTTFNYTGSGIYGAFLLQPSRSDIDDGWSLPGMPPPEQGDDRWTAWGYQSETVPWSDQWATPKTFKVLWYRVHDAAAFAAHGGSPYEKYEVRQTSPGSVWCESLVTIAHPPVKGRHNELVIHFYPDGHLEADIGEDVPVDASPAQLARVDFRQRETLPGLGGKPCLKEVPNPYFGKQRPMEMH